MTEQFKRKLDVIKDVIVNVEIRPKVTALRKLGWGAPVEFAGALEDALETLLTYSRRALPRASEILLEIRGKEGLLGELANIRFRVES